ncbi:unnamed protein product, partial [Arctogadus glacialis]
VTFERSWKPPWLSFRVSPSVTGCEVELQVGLLCVKHNNKSESVQHTTCESWCETLVE